MKREVPRAIQAGWERRFPSLDRPWTHWLLLGGGDHRIGLYDGSNLAGALKAVEESFGRFFTVKVSRVALRPDGSTVEDRTLFEISRLEFDEWQMNESAR